MKLLLDECIPRKLKQYFQGFECVTVPELGFAGKRNGELLSLAEKAGFDAFVTIDRGIEFEQNLRQHTISIVVMRVKSNRLADLVPLVPKATAALQTAQPGSLIRIP